MGLSARLAALSLGAAVSTLLAGGLALLSVAHISAAQARHEQLITVATTALQVDELNDSLRAAVLARYSGVVTRDAAHEAAVGQDIASLRQYAVDLERGDGGPELAAVGRDEDAFAQLVDSLVHRPTIPMSAVLDLQARGESLTERVDGQRETLVGALADDARAEQRGLTRDVAEQFGFSIAVTLVLVLVGWGIRRRLLRSLTDLSSVARAVAGGDLSARSGSTGTDELGRLARELDAMAQALEAAFADQSAQAARRDFRGRLDRALSYADDEDQLASTVAETFAQISPGLPVELLVADASEAHLRMFARSSSAGPAGCSVTKPWSCPAVRNGRSTVFESSNALDACPNLRHRPEGERAAACVPVTFMGRALGVLHAACAPVDLPPPAVREALQDVAEQLGSRLGSLRAFQQVELQASRDGLTGLVNRRAFEDAAHAAGTRPYALLLADLDHFKSVNDTFGHAAGDTALRLFADIMSKAVGPLDVPCRYGGEEFAVLVPGLDVAAAVGIGDRLRELLAAAVSGGAGPVFTVSVGASDSTMAPSLAEQLAIADAALFTAKREGRDRCVAGRAFTHSAPVVSRA